MLYSILQIFRGKREIRINCVLKGRILLSMSDEYSGTYRKWRWIKIFPFSAPFFETFIFLQKWKKKIESTPSAWGHSSETWSLLKFSLLQIWWPFYSQTWTFVFVREYCLKSSAISFVPRNEIYYRFLSLELYTKYHLLMSGLAFGWVAIVFSPPYWWDVRRRVIEWRVKPPVTTNLTRFTVTLNLYETKLNVLYCRLCRCFFHILDWQSIKATFCHVKVGAFSIHRMCLTFARVS